MTYSAAGRSALKLLVDLGYELDHPAGPLRCTLSPEFAERVDKVRQELFAELKEDDPHDAYGIISRPQAVAEYRRAYAVLEVLTEAEIDQRIAEGNPTRPSDPYVEEDCEVCQDHHGGTDTLVNAVCYVCTYEQDAWSADDQQMTADLRRAMESD